MHYVAVRVGEDLNLDVSRPRDEALDVEPAVAERLKRLVTCRGKGGVEVVDLVDQHHAAASAAGGRLEQHGQPHRLDHGSGRREIGERITTSAGRDAQRLCRGAGLHLVATATDRVG